MDRLSFFVAAALALSAGTLLASVQSANAQTAYLANSNSSYDVVRDEAGQLYAVDRRSGRVIARLDDHSVHDDRWFDDERAEREHGWDRPRWQEGLTWRERRARWQRRMERAERRRLQRQRNAQTLREARREALREARREALRRHERWRDDYAAPREDWRDNWRYNAPPARWAERGWTWNDDRPRKRWPEQPIPRPRFDGEEQRRVEQAPLPPLVDEPDRQQNPGNAEEQVARLPELDGPVQRPSTIPSLNRPAYGKTRLMELQIVLDRAGFSPGVIDGRWGSNVAKALRAYRKAKGKGQTKGNTQRRALDLLKPADLKTALAQSGGAALVRYRLTAADVKGPFVQRIPLDYARKAQMTAMSYTSVAEKLAEKFHVSEALLASLNPDRAQFRAGDTITVPAVGPGVTRKVHYLVADKEEAQIFAYDRLGKLVAAYPATIGSAATPSPSGKHTVKTIAFDPQYTYDPVKNFKQGNNDKVLRIPPGPNGPVGSVWIGLSKDSYGIHGTPLPESIGKTNSNGCIRLTNWDAKELAKLVRKGVTVEFRGG